MKRTPCTAQSPLGELDRRRVGGHDAGRNLVANRRHRLGGREQAFLDQAGRDRDDPVAAHRAVALVVHEQHGHVGVVAVRREQDRPVHVAMAARLVDDRPADLVGVLLHPLATVQHRHARHVREPAADDAQRLAGAMQVHGLDGQSGLAPLSAGSSLSLGLGGGDGSCRDDRLRGRRKFGLRRRLSLGIGHRWESNLGYRRCVCGLRRRVE